MIPATCVRRTITAVAAGLLLGCHTPEPSSVPTQLAFTIQPAASVASTQSLGVVRVEFLTQDERPTTRATGDVQISLIPANTAGRLSGSVTASPANGVATFSDLSVDKAATGYQLVAKAPGMDSVVSQDFSVTTGAPARLRFESTVEPQMAGSLLAPVSVGVADAGGNAIATATPTVTLSDASSTVYGTTTVSAVNGVALFSDLSIQTAGIHALTATAPGLLPATSNSFGIAGLQCDRLGFFQPPTDVRAGVPIAPFTVRCVDRYGNPIAIPPGGGMTVTATLGNNPAGATLSGALTVSGFAALTRFDNVVIDKPGTGYTLVLNEPRLGSVTSAPFNILP